MSIVKSVNSLFEGDSEPIVRCEASLQISLYQQLCWSRLSHLTPVPNGRTGRDVKTVECDSHPAASWQLAHKDGDQKVIESQFQKHVSTYIWVRSQGSL